MNIKKMTQMMISIKTMTRMAIQIKVMTRMAISIKVIKVNIDSIASHLGRTTIGIKVHVTEVLQRPKAELKMASDNIR